MKAFVIKNKEGKYYKRYFDAGYVEFVDNFCFAELYTKKEGANDTKDFILRNKYRFNIENLEVVEITIAEIDNSKREYNETIKYIETTEPDKVAEYINNLEQQLAEKDKEIEDLKDKLKRTEKAMHQEVKEHLEYYNADQKQLRKQVCDEIREKLKKQIIPTAGTWLSYYDVIETNNIIDQIEQAKENNNEHKSN